MRNPKAFLKPIFEDIASNLHSAILVQLFCRLMCDGWRIYYCFNQTFKNRFHSYSNKQFVRYHSRTDDAVKEFLLSDFTNENDIFKVSIATIAFDMGVDCKRFHTVVHVPPSIL